MEFQQLRCASVFGELDLSKRNWLYAVSKANRSQTPHPPRDAWFVAKVTQSIHMMIRYLASEKIDLG